MIGRNLSGFAIESRVVAFADHIETVDLVEDGDHGVLRIEGEVHFGEVEILVFRVVDRDESFSFCGCVSLWVSWGVEYLLGIRFSHAFVFSSVGGVENNLSISKTLSSRPTKIFIFSNVSTYEGLHKAFNIPSAVA
jgi:hypothetical protein